MTSAPPVTVCATCHGHLTHQTHVGWTHTNNPTWLNCEEPTPMQEQNT